MSVSRKMSRGALWTLALALLPTCLPSARAASWENAQVSPVLQQDPSYNRYAEILIQIDLLANPATAALPLSVEVPEAGLIHLEGTVPSDRLRRYVVANAQRISGLAVRDNLRIAPIEADYLVSIDSEQLRQSTSDTLTSLFPDLAPKIKMSVGQNGIIVLNGEIPSYESKLMLSQALKSQPGARAVANLLNVPTDERTGEAPISENDLYRVPANQLPTIPPAPILAIDGEENGARSVRSMTGPAQLADDAPAGNLLDQQILEDVRTQLARQPELVDTPLDVDVRNGVVTLSGKVKSREHLESAMSAVADLPDVKKIIAKTRPVSMQRHIPTKHKSSEPAETDAETPAEKKKLFGILPVANPFDSSKDESPAESRRFRETVRRTLKKRCGKRVDDLEIRNTIHGIEIEGEVDNPRDSAFVLKQVDNIVELRNLKYDVILRVKDF